MKYEVNDVIRTKIGREYIITNINDNQTNKYVLLPIQEEYLQEQENAYNNYLKNNKHLNNKMYFIEFVRIEVEERWFKERQCKKIA